VVVTMRLLIALILAVVLAACGEQGSPANGGAVPASGEVANPASVYCEEQGGSVEIRTDEAGAQQGICVFDDGSECDEWALYRGECEPPAD
jgi:uncharacterized protein